MVLLLGTYFARDASYAHEYTDVRMIKYVTKCDDDDTSGLSSAAAAADDKVGMMKKITSDNDVAEGLTVTDKSEASLAADNSDNADEVGRRELRVMVAARVFVGRYAVGHRTYRKPPPLVPTQPFAKSFDSCVNYVDDPTLFVIFDSSQCYPEYFVTYFCESE